MRTLGSTHGNHYLNASFNVDRFTKIITRLACPLLPIKPLFKITALMSVNVATSNRELFAGRTCIRRNGNSAFPNSAQSPQNSLLSNYWSQCLHVSSNKEISAPQHEPASTIHANMRSCVGCRYCMMAIDCLQIWGNQSPKLQPLQKRIAKTPGLFKGVKALFFVDFGKYIRVKGLVRAYISAETKEFCRKFVEISENLPK